MKLAKLKWALAAAGVVTIAGVPGHLAAGNDLPDPLLEGGALCAPARSGQSALLKAMILAKTETSQFQPAATTKPVAPGDAPLLYKDLGSLAFKVSTKNARAQQYFNQGLVFAFAFNHAEAQRAFQAAQKLDPGCAMCFWGEAFVLGPNINVPMSPEANAPALAALAKARAIPSGTPKERALIEALATRYSADPKAEREKLDVAFADAMREVAKRFPADDSVQALYAESVMDTQPWDYWEAAGAKPKGRNPEIVGTLEKVLKRNPDHPGAIHLYIHAVEASTQPEKALPYANRLARLVPGAGHIVHMPAHIYYRVGMYRESLELNKKAMAVDERYFTTSPSDPVYRGAYYPHNIHFVMVSAQMGGDAKTALEAAAKLDAAMPADVVKQFPIMQPVKAAPYTTHAQFSDADTILKLPAASADLLLVKALEHYARAVAYAMKKDAAGAKAQIAALEKLEKEGDFKPFDAWGIPAKEIVQTATLVARGRLADAQGDLAGAAKAYEDAIFIEDTLVYTEPPYWYYPVRQSLGSVRLRQGKLDEARTAFRDSLARVRNNGWALAGLVETERKRGDAKAEKAAQRAFQRAWFGAAAPELGRL